MNSSFTGAVLSLKNSRYVTQETIDDFLHRIKSNPKLLKSEGVRDHFCIGIKVVNAKEKKIFLGHHIKSGHWMGPGGHIEKGETPLDTARRECEEEIQYKPKKFSLYEIIHFDKVEKPSCSDHYDFGFYTIVDGTPTFNYDKHEFSDAKWLSFEEALIKKLLPEHRRSLSILFKQIEDGEVS